MSSRYMSSVLRKSLYKILKIEKIRFSMISKDRLPFIILTMTMEKKLVLKKLLTKWTDQNRFMSKSL